VIRKRFDGLAATAIAPKSNVNTMPYFVGGGLSYQGVIPGRDKDIASAGIIYGPLAAIFHAGRPRRRLRQITRST